MFIDQATIRVKAGDGGTSVYAEPEHSEGKASPVQTARAIATETSFGTASRRHWRSLAPLGIN